jgi:hypothetical protein
MTTSHYCVHTKAFTVKHHEKVISRIFLIREKWRPFKKVSAYFLNIFFGVSLPSLSMIVWNKINNNNNDSKLQSAAKFMLEIEE